MELEDLHTEKYKTWKRWKTNGNTSWVHELEYLILKCLYDPKWSTDPIPTPSNLQRHFLQEYRTNPSIYMEPQSPQIATVILRKTNKGGRITLPNFKICRMSKQCSKSIQKYFYVKKSIQYFYVKSSHIDQWDRSDPRITSMHTRSANLQQQC